MAEPSLEEINRRLEKGDFHPVSKRMFTHYRRLSDAGYGRYISINRFDVARASEPYESLSTNARYGFWDADLPVQVTFPRGRRLVEAMGRASKVGESGLLLGFEDQDVAEGMVRDRPRVGEIVRVDFVTSGGAATARVTDADRVGKAFIVEVEFIRLQSIGAYVSQTALPLRRFRVVVRGDNELAIDVVGRRVFQVFELIETARGFANQAAEATSSPYAPVARVEELSMRSPLAIVVAIPIVVGAAVATAVKVLDLAIRVEDWRERRRETATSESEHGARRAQADLDEVRADTAATIVKDFRQRYQLGEPQAKAMAELINKTLLTQVVDLAETGVRDVAITKSRAKRSGSPPAKRVQGKSTARQLGRPKSSNT